jgi:glycosyltransferase involved in cell wall biosynthesis
MLSAVIPAHNEEAVLPATLDALRQALEATGEPFEIVLVDDSSTDRTAEIAAARGAAVVRIESRQIAAARNAGARAAKGDIIVFVDADTIVPPETIAAALRALESGHAGGGARVRFDEPVPRWVAPLLSIFMVLYRLGRLLPGCFMFCTREAFERIRGFDQSLYGGEEVDFALRLRRVGRTVLLREITITSGRKLRAYRARELFGTLLFLALLGRRGVRNRDRLGMWYGPRRPDPRP